MDAYFNAMDALGDKIIAFVDPNNEFNGYTKVSGILMVEKWTFDLFFQGIKILDEFSNMDIFLNTGMDFQWI